VEPFLRENPPLQLIVLAALAGLILLSVWRPVLGLTLSAVAMVLTACRIYYDAGPTSSQVTTAAVYMVGGFIASGFAGYIRLLERPATKTVPEPEAESAAAWDWIDAPEDSGRGRG
jgi:hypothetical protein